jgi:hypothetical protein
MCGVRGTGCCGDEGVVMEGLRVGWLGGAWFATASSFGGFVVIGRGGEDGVG